MPKLADAVMAGVPSLNDAYAQAIDHEKKTNEIESNMARLKTGALDLYNLVEGELQSLPEALVVLASRQAKARAEAAAKADRGGKIADLATLPRTASASPSSMPTLCHRMTNLSLRLDGGPSVSSSFKMSSY